MNKLLSYRQQKGPRVAATAAQIDLESVDVGAAFKVMGSGNEFDPISSGVSADIESYLTSLESQTEGLELTPIQKEAALATEAFIAGIGSDAGVASRFLEIDHAKKGQLVLNPTHVEMSSEALEAFTPQQASSFRTQSVRFNIGAARQARWAEEIYPTVVVPADSFGFAMELPVDEIFVQNKHDSITGKGIELRRAMDASVDSSMLTDSSIRLQQIYNDQNKSVLSEIAATRVNKTIFGTEVTVAPIRMGKSLNLITLTTHEALVGKGVMDITDDIDRTARIQNVYVTLSNDDAGTLKTAVLLIPTKHIGSALFMATEQGNVDVLKANLEYTVALNGDTKDITGTDLATALGLDFAGASIHALITLNTSVNVGDGMLTPAAGTFTISKVVDAAGDEVVGGALEAAIVAGGLRLDSFDIDGSRTGTNGRSTGIEMRTTIDKHPLPIGLAAPLTAIYPAGSDSTEKGLERLANLNAKATNAAAIRSLVSWYDHVRAVNGVEVRAETHGAGANYMRPAAVEMEVDLGNFITNDQTNRAEGAKSAIVGAVHSAISTAVRSSRIYSAYEQILGDVRPHAVLLTTPDVESLLMVTGDERTLGTTMKSKVVSNDFSELRVGDDSAYIYAVLTNEEEGVNPLKYGNHFMMPSIVSDRIVSRSSRQARELQVYPRRQHHNHVPVIVRVLVKNVSKAFNTAV